MNVQSPNAAQILLGDVYPADWSKFIVLTEPGLLIGRGIPIFGSF